MEAGRDGESRIAASSGAGEELVELPSPLPSWNETFFWLRIRGRRLDLREIVVDCDALRPPFEPSPDGEKDLRALHAFLRSTGPMAGGR